MGEIVTPSGLSVITHINTTQRQRIDPYKALEAIQTLAELQRSQEVTQKSAEVHISTEHPILVTYYGDLHLGNIDTRYDIILQDLLHIRDSDNIFLVLMGDEVDNMFWLRNAGDVEVTNELTQGYVCAEIINDIDSRGKLIGVVTGNHNDFYRNWYSMFMRELSAPIIGVNMGTIFLKVGSITYEHFLFHKLSVGNSYMSVLLREHKAIENLAPNADVCVGAHCFDDKTELLTRNGWKPYTELHKGDMAMTLNSSNKLEWNKIKEKVVYDHFKELVLFENRIMSLAVTRGHGLIVGKPGPYRKGKTKISWYKTSAGACIDELGKGTKRYFKMSGTYDKTKIKLKNCWIKLMAWIFADGNLSFRDNRIRRIRIAQSDNKDNKKDTIRKIEKTLKECNIPFSKVLRYKRRTKKHGTYRNYNAYNYSLHGVSEIYKKLSPYMGKKKEMRWKLLDMNTKQSKIFLKTFILGDGYKNKDAKYSYQIGAKRKNHIDVLQAIAAKCGFRTSVCKAKDGNLTYLTLNSRGIGMLHTKSIRTIPYNGKTWCVSVENGTLLVRRNGKVVITQNTHRKSIGKYCKGIDDNRHEVILIETGTMKPNEGFQRSQGNVRMAQFDFCGASTLLYPNEKKMEVFYTLESGERALQREIALRTILTAKAGELDYFVGK